MSYKAYVLLKSATNICSLSQLCFFDVVLEKSWVYVFPRNEMPWVVGATIAYRRALWQKINFADLRAGEDIFLYRVGSKVATDFYVAGFVSILPTGNTSPKLTTGCR